MEFVFPPFNVFVLAACVLLVLADLLATIWDFFEKTGRFGP